MEKPADNRHPIHDLLRRRWSPRSFADREVPDATLLSLLEAARWAPSCFNEQPWSFLVATRSRPEEYERMLGCLVENNRRWAASAPVLMLGVAKRHFERNGKPNRHALHDVGLAVENLVVEATAHGLSVHQMAGIDRRRAVETYGIPDDHEPVSGIALGYAGDPAALPEDLRERETAPRTRRPLARQVFSGAWGRTAGFVPAEQARGNG